MELVKVKENISKDKKTRVFLCPGNKLLARVCSPWERWRGSLGHIFGKHYNYQRLQSPSKMGSELQPWVPPLPTQSQPSSGEGRIKIWHSINTVKKTVDGRENIVQDKGDKLGEAFILPPFNAHHTRWNITCPGPMTRKRNHRTCSAKRRFLAAKRSRECVRPVPRSWTCRGPPLAWGQD